MKLDFTKMQGCGNDYVYINCFEQTVADPAALAVRLSDRHTGIGGDGVILICPSDVADAKMRMFNLDGSEGKMCGNGVRCVAEYLFTHGMNKRADCVDIETLSGIKHIVREAPQLYTVDMGAPILKPSDIPVTGFDENPIIDRLVEVNGGGVRITCVSMGNPHCVVFVDDVNKLNLPMLGNQFEHAKIFPEGVNTEFVQRIDETHLKMRVWERGSGETLACGTGTCACVVASVLCGYCPMNADVEVVLLGGVLTIRYTGETVYMTGNAVTVFDGTVEV